MRFSLFFLTADPPGRRRDTAGVYRDLLGDVVEAEALGFEAVWLAEHHFSRYGGHVPSIPVLGAAAAARTRRIRIGAAAAILPLRDAVETAESFAMLDVLSGGRLEMGVGRGFLPLEFAGRGIGLDERAGRFREGLDVLLRAWGGGPFSYHGQHYSLDDVEVLPQPLQRPHPPVWVAASTSRESFELAGSRGFGLMVNPYTRTRDEVEQGLAWYRDARRRAGHDPGGGRVMANQHMFVAATEEEARERPREALLAYLASVNEAFAHRNPAGPSALAPDAYDAVYPGKVLFGTPDDVVRRVKEWEALGVTDICCAASFGDLDPGVRRRSMRLFAERVLPCFAT